MVFVVSRFVDDSGSRFAMDSSCRCSSLLHPVGKAKEFPDLTPFIAMFLWFVRTAVQLAQGRMAGVKDIGDQSSGLGHRFFLSSKDFMFYVPNYVTSFNTS